MKSPKAYLRIVESLPEGDRNRPVEIEATEDGIVIEEFITISWDWIDRARLVLAANSITPAEASASSQAEGSPVARPCKN